MSLAPDITKSMPFSNDAEKGVLSCFLHNPTELLSDAAATIPAEAFYHPANRLLYEVMQERQREGYPIEYIGISQHLQDKGLMDKIGGQGALAELLDFVPTPTHYGYYKGILRDKLTVRRILALCTDGAQKCYEYQDDVPALLGSLTEQFFALSKQEQTSGRKDFRQIMIEYVDTWEARMKGEIETGIPTRWESFNRTFGGITPRLWLIAGFPSDGKSTLLQNMIEDTLRHGRHVLWFSYEMEEIEICDRLVTSQTQLNSQIVFFPQNGINRHESKKITEAVGEIQKWGLHLRCEATWTAEQILAETRAMQLKHPIGLVAVDYLQLVPSGKDFDMRSSEVAFMSRVFKLASMSLGLPFVVLSQLNDDGKTKESRAPNQDASNILFIEQAVTTTDRKGNKSTTEAGLRVVKNRNGKRGDLLPIRLCGQTFTFNEHCDRP